MKDMIEFELPADLVAQGHAEGVNLPQIYKLAKLAHTGQVDKAGKDYIHHPERVAMMLYARGAGPRVFAVGLLHDVVEDTHITLQNLRDMKIPEDIVKGVDAITHRAGESNEDYYIRLREDELAREAKLADIDDNANPERLAILPEKDQIRLTRKYKNAREKVSVKSR